MKTQRSFSEARFIMGSALAIGMLLFPRPSSGQIDGPLPPIKKPPNLVPLTPVEQLGKDIVFDTTLSNPPGYACFTCHTPETGFASPGPPDGSEVNAFFGIPSGVVPGRATNRKPMTYAATAFSPIGPFYDSDVGVYIGGGFWDGRVPDEAHQATQPFIDANEMANLSSNGIQDPVAGGYSALVVQKVEAGKYAKLFKEVYGKDVFSKYTTPQLYTIITEAIAAYEASAEVNPFNSKYDSSKYGVPAQNLYTLSASEERGRILYGVGGNPSNNPLYGAAQCFQCHSSQTLTIVQAETDGKETFTMFCYANIGVPKNPNNPYYENTDATTNPFGYNPLGTKYKDFGLGSNPNPAPDGTVFYKTTPGDILEFRGLFKAPSVRNSDKRPTPTFVRAYMHNGVFKSLEQVVNFYNKRNIAVNAAGQEVAFDLRQGPPSGYTALLPPPEVLDNVQNVAGLTPAQAAATGVSGTTATNGQVGNLQLTASQATDLVNFLKILTDGYGPITPVNYP
jgi:cytochrome c peroxidase